MKRTSRASFRPKTWQSSLHVVLALLCLRAAPAVSAIDTLVVLHTNDFHGYISPDGDRAAGLARIATYFDHERARSSKVLALDAGDCVSGTPVSILFQGRPIFEAMTAVGYDAVTLGNHEFDYGWREILAYRDIADFPLLSANARSPAGELIADAPFTTLILEDLHVGIVGVTTEKTRDITTTRGNEGVTFDGEIASVRAAVDSIKSHVDIVILLSHAGHVADSTLAESVDDIDLIVSGHNHTVLSPPQIVRGTPIVRAGAYTSHVGHVQLLYDHDAGEVTKVEGFVVPAADDQLQQPDPKIAAIVAKWEDRVSQLVDVTIGHTERDWSKEEMYMLVEHILATQSSSDIGFYNKGGVRNRLYQGNITARHIWNIHPFGNQLAIVQIRGKDIGGELSERLTTAGTAINPDHLYTVATSSFVVEPPRRESFIGTAKSVWLEEDLIRDVVINYIKEGGPIDALLTPTTTEE
ncbi:MAG: bifunctional UDP-sugar hydrolase/5'-nucleotidase [Gemmatimonadetes bacterium]|nr:bifunctional UDP-sugar hydrolase/5'-nucleotidase [Gemmatimonadota bacterium]